MNKRIRKKHKKPISTDKIESKKTVIKQEIDEKSFSETVEQEIEKEMNNLLLENEIEYFKFVKKMTSNFDHLVFHGDILMNNAEGKRGIIHKVSSDRRQRIFFMRYREMIEKFKEEIGYESEKKYLERKLSKLQEKENKLGAQTEEMLETTTLIRIIKTRLSRILEKEAEKDEK